MTKPRSAAHPIEPIFLKRWSPRAFDATEVPIDDLLTMIEAARWAPSAYNIQPWRFLYAQRGDAHWQRYLGLLDAFNFAWAQNAGALVFVISDTLIGAHPSEKQSHTHDFDTGAAWAQLALQATAMGYQAHAMAGIDFNATRETLEIPDRYRIEIAVAIGTQADPAILPAELQTREAPSDRLPLDQLAFGGAFPHEHP